MSKISHDLRNILSSAQLLSDRLVTVKDPDRAGLVPKLIASLDRAIRLCARTLDFGQAQEMPPRRKRFALCPTRQRSRRQSRAAAAKTHRLEARHRGGARGRCRPRPAFRVLTNLCRNAVQALESEDGAAPARSWSPARREGSVTSSKSADTGPGVPERARAHLFKAFQSVARKGGTGLGLAIAAELVQAHGGEVDTRRQ